MKEEERRETESEEKKREVTMVFQDGHQKDK